MLSIYSNVELIWVFFWFNLFYNIQTVAVGVIKATTPKEVAGASTKSAQKVIYQYPIFIWWSFITSLFKVRNKIVINCRDLLSFVLQRKIQVQSLNEKKKQLYSMIWNHEDSNFYLTLHILSLNGPLCRVHSGVSQSSGAFRVTSMYIPKYIDMVLLLLIPVYRLICARKWDKINK